MFFIKGDEGDGETEGDNGDPSTEADSQTNKVDVQDQDADRDDDDDPNDPSPSNNNENGKDEKNMEYISDKNNLNVRKGYFENYNQFV